MSEVHLKDIRRCLEEANWIIADELEGDDYQISAVWVIARPNGDSRFHLEFEGLDDMRKLPIDQSYGCSIREAQEIGCYFSREGRSWPHELAEFDRKLRQWSQE